MTKNLFDDFIYAILFEASRNFNGCAIAKYLVWLTKESIERRREQEHGTYVGGEGLIGR